MKRIIAIITALALMPAILKAQKGHHFEFNYFALEVGVINSFNGAPDYSPNRYYASPEGYMHLLPKEGAQYTPGLSVGLQFHHDMQNDVTGLIFGALINVWGNTAQYQTADKKVTITETNRATSITLPFYVKMGRQIYNNQGYFYVGTQLGYNIKVNTTQKSNKEKKALKSDIYNDGANKLNIPIVAGFNYKIINVRFVVQPKGFLNKSYEMPVGLDGGDARLIKPFEGMDKATFSAHFAFVIPLSQWTIKRSYFLSRIF